jgi:hypothetical protein
VAITTCGSCSASTPSSKIRHHHRGRRPRGGELHASQWTLRISRFEEEDETLFNAVASVLKTCLTASDYGRLTGGEASTMRRWVDKIPTDKLLEISDRLRTAIAENIAEADQRFAWRMLSNHPHASSRLLIGDPAQAVDSSDVVPCPRQREAADLHDAATLGAGGTSSS